MKRWLIVAEFVNFWVALGKLLLALSIFAAFCGCKKPLPPGYHFWDPTERWQRKPLPDPWNRPSPYDPSKTAGTVHDGKLY